ncbi:hypothetical protein [Rhizobium sp. BK251]|uniref:hypothetical protein n=1 Tax=Rhizobium sp. BK251 TaxID=2512125 RepID=UPI00104F507A|nr:hypothetical protein [Rhizobium sp. BK251]TCL76200.1 hypothetical protein EV286_101748 [Rhizobium sp. BK251]
MTFSAEQLARHPDFIESLRQLALELRGVFDAGPRLARLLASHQRWLMTQTAYALHLDYDPSDPSSGLTVARLTDAITSHRIASRNTVLSFLDELLTYRFITIRSGDMRRRPRRFEAAQVSHAAMFKWLGANLSALDLLDGGGRAATLAANPGIMPLAQPRIARNCLESAEWRDPPAHVGLFMWTEAGGMVVDELVAKLDLSNKDEGRIESGPVNVRRMANELLISRTHLQRLFAKAVDSGCLSWREGSKRTYVSLSADFLRDYCRWQAVKFALVDEAFHWAKAELQREYG